MSKITINDIINYKNKKFITCLTAYSVSIAKIIDNHVDIILIGDSVGTAIYGMKNTQSVSLEMMKAHGKAVCSNSKKSFTIVDMPYGTYKNENLALKNAKEIINYTRCDSVKLEIDEENIHIVKYLTKNNINVVTHIGVTPQKYSNFNKIKAIGKNLKEEKKIIKLAKKLEEANSCLIVLECIYSNIAKKITDMLSIPTIGIGSSSNCDGQVMVINDLLETDSTLRRLKFIKSYTNLSKSIEDSVKKYCNEVINKKFPLKKHSYF